MCSLTYARTWQDSVVNGTGLVHRWRVSLSRREGDTKVTRNGGVRGRKERVDGWKIQLVGVVVDC